MTFLWPLQHGCIWCILSGNSLATQLCSQHKENEHQHFLNLADLAALLLSRQPQVYKQLSEELERAQGSPSAEADCTSLGVTAGCAPCMSVCLSSPCQDWPLRHHAHWEHSRQFCHFWARSCWCRIRKRKSNSDNHTMVWVGRDLNAHLIPGLHWGEL